MAHGHVRPVSPGVDHAALFAAIPDPHVVLDRDLVIVEVNDAVLKVTGLSRDDVIGRRLFDVLPDGSEHADNRRSLCSCLRRVLASGKAETLAIRRYDVRPSFPPGDPGEQWWAPVVTPVFEPDGTVGAIIVRPQDVTRFVLDRRLHGRRSENPPSAPLLSRLLRVRDDHPGDTGRWQEAVEAEAYQRGQELERLNEELRQAHTRERAVALALQESMLHSPDLPGHPDIAVRYLPAVGTLNVCGDWYDVNDLPSGGLAMAVGDVVGHGLEAATVMGMLRSALSAAARTVAGPAQALETVGVYARSVEGAPGSTAVQVMVDTENHRITYSSAGHLPPVLLRAGDGCEFLDGATDPPLGARPVHVARPQTATCYAPGDTLVLYTDGLVERRKEDIDVGLARLTGVLASFAGLDPERMADAVLARLGFAAGGANDDIALIIARL
ncbi:PP2C family protein-serine/threonine phosphatase [Actinomadura viridis]|uniref:PP2C family protein-serine/threonine phosphatase n=1 Tax=Actinomadura viridis TaxID=58110 RepID=UPI00368B4015